jgi:hypothetical protein
MPRGCQTALIGLRGPGSAVSQGQALTLKQVEVLGLRLGEPGNGERVNTLLLALCERCGWPAHVGSAGGAESTQGIVETFLAAPNRASWRSAVSHLVANILKHSSPKVSLCQQLQRRGTRMRHRLQHTRLAFVLPPTARAKGRCLRARRQAAWGLQPLAYVEAKAREASPDVSALAQALRGRTSLQRFLMTCVRNTTCVHEGMQLVHTQGVRAESMHACQEPLGD